MFVPMLVAVAAGCGDGGRAADSIRAVEREDSIRRLGAAAWTDGQLIAYLKVVSSTLAADGPLVERRARSAAIRTFGRTVQAEHRRVLRLVDSLESRRPPEAPPLVSSEALRKHEAEMRRLARDGDFDGAYLSSTLATLHDVNGQLDKADSTRYTAAVAQLLRRARTAVRAELRTGTTLAARIR